jgi:amino acid transporter
MWITRVTSLAVIANVMASYLAYFWAPAGSGWGRATAMTAVVVPLTVINLVGVRQAAGTATVLAIGKLMPLLLFVAVGLFFLDPGSFAGARPPDAGSFTQSVLLLIFAFGGFEAVVVAAGEMQEPRRNLPFALLVSIGGATLLYVLIQVVCIGTLPGLGASEKPLADASVRFMGAAGASVIAAGALISTVGTLCAILLVGPRVLFAMSAQDQLPRLFARTHRRFQTPHVAIMLTAGVGLALSISGTFTYLLGINVIARLTAYLSTAAALLVFRRVERDRPALFSVPAGGFVATLALAACAWLLARSGARELRDVGIALAAGLCVFAADRWWRARRAVAPAAPGS